MLAASLMVFLASGESFLRLITRNNTIILTLLIKPNVI